MTTKLLFGYEKEREKSNKHNVFMKYNKYHIDNRIDHGYSNVTVFATYLPVI